MVKIISVILYVAYTAFTIISIIQEINRGYRSSYNFVYRCRHPSILKKEFQRAAEFAKQRNLKWGFGWEPTYNFLVKFLRKKNLKYPIYKKYFWDTINNSSKEYIIKDFFIVSVYFIVCLLLPLRFAIYGIFVINFFFLYLSYHPINFTPKKNEEKPKKRELKYNEDRALISYYAPGWTQTYMPPDIYNYFFASLYYHPHKRYYFPLKGFFSINFYDEEIRDKTLVISVILFLCYLCFDLFMDMYQVYI